MAHESERQAVLATATTAIGDTLLGLPAMDALAKSFDLDVLVHQRCASLLQGRPGIRNIYTYRNNPLMRAWVALRLLGRHYHRVVVLHSNDDILRLLPRLSYGKAANVQGWEDAGLRLTSLHEPEIAHFTLERLRLAAWCGAAADPAPMHLPLSENELRAGEKWLRDQGLKHGNRGLVALCPGAAKPFKRWPAERFGRVAEALGAEGYGILVVGSVKERALYDAIAGHYPRTTPLLGQPLRLAAAVLAQIDLLITNDTGTLHLAQAVNTKALAIFGPTPPERYAPQSQGSRYLQVKLTCDDCKGMDCTYPHCLEALQPQEVLDLARSMLAEGTTD
jgi:ADP-heptose:LPS heptosyltransferase